MFISSNILNENLEENKKIDEIEQNMYSNITDPITSRITRISSEVKNIALSDKANDPVEDTDNNIAIITNYILDRVTSQDVLEVSEIKKFRESVAQSYKQEWEDYLSRQTTPISLGQATKPFPPIYKTDQIAHTCDDINKELDANSNLLENEYTLNIDFESYLHNLDKNIITLEFKIYYELDQQEDMLTLILDINQNASMLIKKILNRIMEIHNIELDSYKEYVLQVVGRKEYIYMPYMLQSFRYIDNIVKLRNKTNNSSKLQTCTLRLCKLPFPSSFLAIPRFVPTYKQIDNAMHPSIDSDNATPFTTYHLKNNFYFQLFELSNLFIPGHFIKDMSAEFDEKERSALLHFKQSNNSKARNTMTVNYRECYICIVAELTFGGCPLDFPVKSKWHGPVQLTSIPIHNFRFDNYINSLEFNLPVYNIPREARVLISIFVCTDTTYRTVKEWTAAQILAYIGIHNYSTQLLLHMIEYNPKISQNIPQEELKLICLASVNIQIREENGMILTGLVHKRLWEMGIPNSLHIATSNPNYNAINLHLIFPEFAVPVYFPSCNAVPPTIIENSYKENKKQIQLKLGVGRRENDIKHMTILTQALKKLCLEPLNNSERALIWEHRYELSKYPNSLVKILLATNWACPSSVHRIHQLIKVWPHLAPIDALELLDSTFPDTEVRCFAIRCISHANDQELFSCLLQLIQVLKYEPYHYSPLACFLLSRSLQTPHIIGHALFWHLMAESQNPSVSERYQLIIEEYIKRLPTRRELLRQVYVNDLILDIAIKVKEFEANKRNKKAQTLLKDAKLPPKFTLPLDSSWECVGIISHKCKIMSSKKLPIWMEFCNSDPLCEPLTILFKAGDDLRQDLLTLQLLSIMDSLWMKEDLNLCLIPYQCVATGEGIGMIQVVLQSNTIANITKEHGGANSVFSQFPILNWLRKNNPQDIQSIELFLMNFAFSCAGYCTATYVLGIGDRHNDNIMIRKDGNLFHIDFGHFLGNFKSKFGIKRETAPFVFTPMFAYVLGGEGSPLYEFFSDLSLAAFKILRKNANRLIIHFKLMLSTGMPELQTLSDILWLQSVLFLDNNLSENQVDTQFKALIHSALTNKRTLINDYIHILYHT